MHRVLPGTTIALAVAVENLQHDDQIEVTLNGQRVRQLRRREKRPLTAQFASDGPIAERNHALPRLVRRSADSPKARTPRAPEIDVVFPKAD